MPGGRPTKPLSLVKGHRTKAEKKVREKAESALLTGSSLKEFPEVKANEIAHKEFVRIKKLLRAINKDDDLSGNVINTHCLLHAECKQYERLKEGLYKEIVELTKLYSLGEFDFITYSDRKGSIEYRIFECDKKIMAKRKLLLDIDKENILTIQSALRSIPKQPEKQAQSPMAAFLAQRNGASGS